mmetsp:Transcript_114109/g.327835  ORF Transcript_114109/g.327835 Transcript_114109/m.327835 type:complete len:217 (-) Transcript_114109:8-658(-)
MHGIGRRRPRWPPMLRHTACALVAGAACSSQVSPPRRSHAKREGHEAAGEDRGDHGADLAYRSAGAREHGGGVRDVEVRGRGEQAAKPGHLPAGMRQRDAELIAGVEDQPANLGLREDAGEGGRVLAERRRHSRDAKSLVVDVDEPLHWHADLRALLEAFRAESHQPPQRRIGAVQASGRRGTCDAEEGSRNRNERRHCHGLFAATYTARVDRQST